MGKNAPKSTWYSRNKDKALENQRRYRAEKKNKFPLLSIEEQNKITEERRIKGRIYNRKYYNKKLKRPRKKSLKHLTEEQKKERKQEQKRKWFKKHQKELQKYRYDLRQKRKIEAEQTFLKTFAAKYE